MTLTLAAMLLALGLFMAMLLFLELGRQTGLHRLKQDPDGLASGTGTAEGAVFGLLGLLIAFTFPVPPNASSSGVTSSPRRPTP